MLEPRSCASRARSASQRPQPLGTDQLLTHRRGISAVQGSPGLHRADQRDGVAVLDPGPAHELVIVLTGLGFVIAAFNAAIRVLFAMGRGEFRLWRHLVIPATAAVLFLFPLWGILHPRAYGLVDLLPLVGVGWLCLGVIAAGILRARRPASF